jgi:dipeptidyl aminopeptidase/acylaminoacyl peptidase
MLLGDMASNEGSYYRDHMTLGIRSSILALLIGALTLSVITPATAAPVSPIGSSIPAAFDREYSGSDLKVGQAFSSSAKYTRHRISYETGGLTISGIMIKPTGKGPFPVAVLAHGYIDPATYWSGQGFRREQDWLGNNGYVALHVDYRNHARSDNDPNNDVSMRLGYAEDVIGAALAVKGSELSYLDKDKVALLGRSMGGGVAFQALVLQPGIFNAAITYASTSTLAADNFNKWQRNDYPIGNKILKEYGTPKENPIAWQNMSSRYYFSRITEPVLMIHGTKDESCDISWARATNSALERSGVDVTYVEYPGAPHYMFGEWNDSIKQVNRFLKKNLR